MELFNLWSDILKNELCSFKYHFYTERKNKYDYIDLCHPYVPKNWIHCVKIVQIRNYFWSLFSCIRTEYRKIWTRNNSVFGHISRSISASGSNFKLNFSVKKHNEFALTRSLIKSNCTSGSMWLRTSDAVKADGKSSLSIKMEKLLQKYQLYHPLI